MGLELGQRGEQNFVETRGWIFIAHRAAFQQKKNNFTMNECVYINDTKLWNRIQKEHQESDFKGSQHTHRMVPKKRSNNTTSATLVFNFKSPFKCIKKYIVTVWLVIVPVMVPCSMLVLCIFKGESVFKHCEQGGGLHIHSPCVSLREKVFR